MLKCKIVLQNSTDKKPYMWAYWVKNEGEIICSGGLYYSIYPNQTEAIKAIKKEIENRVEMENYNINDIEFDY